MNSTAEPLVEALQRLDAKVDAVLTAALRNDAPRGMTDAAALDFARAVEALGRRIDAARLLAAAELDDRSRPDRGDARLSARLGCANAAELLVRTLRIASFAAQDRIRAARPLATSTSLSGATLPAAFPELREVVCTGAVGVDTVTALTRTLGPIAGRCAPDALAAAESELVAAAIGVDDAPPCTPDETRMQAKVWTLVLDPDGVLPDYERAMRKRRITLGREVDGIVPFRGALLPDVAAQFQRLADAQLSPRVEDHTLEALPAGPTFVESDSPDEDHRDDPRHVVPHDPRTRAQKLHDVLATVLGVAARSSETPTLGGAPPTLLVTIAASDLERDDGFGFIDGTDTTVPSFVARQIACCGGIQRLIFAENGRVIELGNTLRAFNAHQRRGITARDGGCIIPGCGVRAEWCEIHHVVEHAKGGPTHTDNGVTLCWYHHRTLDTSGWQVRMVDGVPELKAPFSVDPYLRWRPVLGSAHRQREHLRRRDTG